MADTVEGVKQKIAEVEEEIKQVKSRIKQPDLLPKDDPDRQELVALRQELVELRKEKNLRLAEGVAGAAGAAVLRAPDQQGPGQDIKQQLEDLHEQVAELQTRSHESAQTSRTHALIGQDMQKTGTFVSLSAWDAFDILSSSNPQVVAAAKAVKEAWPEVKGTGRSFKDMLDKTKKRKLTAQLDHAAGQSPSMSKKRKLSQQGPSAAGGQCQGSQQQGTQAGQATQQSELPLMLPDMCNAEAGIAGNGFTVDRDMQPVCFEMVKVVNKAVSTAETHVMDTHKTGLHNPEAQPDAVRFAQATTLPAWSLVDIHFEFKLRGRAADTAVAVGQATERTQYSLMAQPLRTAMASAIITMDSVKLLHFRSTHRTKYLAKTSTSGGSAENERRLIPPGRLALTCTDHLPLTMDPKSSGFRALCSLLAQSPASLGYIPDDPPTFDFKKYKVRKPILIAQGSARCGGNYVYQVEVKGKSGRWMKAVAKLCKTNDEARHLKAMQDCRFVVNVLDECTCQVWGANYHTVLLAPFVERIEDGMLTLKELAQVLLDVASGVEALWKKRKAHRDIGLNNIGWHEVAGKKRGVVLDLSAVKDFSRSTGSPPKPPHEITGTFAYMALSVLQGREHSSHLESIFISVAAVCFRGKLPDQPKVLQPDKWARHRLATFAGGPITIGPPHLLPLVNALHDLFWPDKSEGGLAGRLYRQDVTVAEFKATCTAAAELGTAAM